MPESQRGILKQSFKLEAEQLNEMAKDEAMLKPDLVAKNISKQYIQDLFRFFRIYPLRADFADMFTFTLTMHRSYLFDILSGGSNIKSNVATYYFSKNHFVQALDLFQDIQLHGTPTAALYQKIAYSYQQTSQLSKALEAYIKADIINPDDIWTVRKIALCYRLSGNFEKALEYYQHADYLKPDQTAIMMQIGQCYLQIGKYKEALMVYFKMDALEGDNVKVWRAITWCSFVSGNISQAEYYVTKLIESEPTAHDYLNAGHVAWCRGQRADALSFYRNSLALQQLNMDRFIETFNEDKKFLITNGIDADELPLMMDELMFSQNR